MIDRHDIRKVFEALQHGLEQKLMNHFPDSDYAKVEGIIEDTLNEVYDELADREFVLVKDDDLSCMEYDYEEACDRLMTVRALAIEGEGCIPSVRDDTNDHDDLVGAYGKFNDIIYEVER